jgi:hypothetical protein
MKRSSIAARSGRAFDALLQLESGRQIASPPLAQRDGCIGLMKGVLIGTHIWF